MENWLDQFDEGNIPMYGQGSLIKRADGSYSKRGLWDNIRANRGSGRKPTAEMLRQERKIKKHDEGSFVEGEGEYLPIDPRTGLPVKNLKGVEVTADAPDTYNNYMLKKHRNDGLAEAMFGMPLDYVFGFPQAAATKLFTGKYQTPSEAMDIQNPYLGAGVDMVADPTNLIGVGLLNKEKALAKLGNESRKLIYKGVDPMFYNPSEKVKRFIPNLLTSEKDKIKRVETIMRNAGVRGSYRKAQNRLDAWKLGLGLPQEYNTFEQVGKNTFAINPKFFSFEPEVQQGLIAHAKAFDLKDKYLNNIINSEQYEKGLVNINKKMYDRVGDNFYGRYIKEKNIPFEPELIVERKGDKGFSIYDQDRYAGVMGGFRWDIDDISGDKIKLTAKDTWNVHPFEKRGATRLADLTSLKRQQHLIKGYIPALKNVEILNLIGGKPYDIENTFTIDKYKQGGWVDMYAEGDTVTNPPSELEALLAQYQTIQDQVNKSNINKNAYVENMRKTADDLIAKGFSLEESGILPESVMNNPTNTGYCIGTSCYLADQAGDKFYPQGSNFFTSNSAAQDYARDNSNASRYLEQSEKFIAPGDIVQFKSGDEKGMPYHAYTVYDIGQPNEEGDRVVTVVGSPGHGPMHKKTYVLGSDNKIYSDWGNGSKGDIHYTQLLKRREDNTEYNNLLSQRDALKQQILGIDPLYFTPKEDVRADDYRQTGFELNDQSNANGRFVVNEGIDKKTGKPKIFIQAGDEYINASDSQLTDIIAKYNNPQYKYDYMRTHNISSDEYDAAVKNMVGIYGAETKFGTDYTAEGKWPESPWLSKAANTIGHIPFLDKVIPRAAKLKNENRSIGPFQIKYNQLPEKYRKTIEAKDLYDPMTGADATMENLTAGLSLLRKRANTTAETATDNNPYSQNITKENYLEYLPYLNNMRTWLKGDEYTQEKYGDVLKGDAGYKGLVDQYSNNVLQILPSNLTTPQPLEVIPQQRNGGYVQSFKNGGCCNDNMYGDGSKVTTNKPPQKTLKQALLDYKENADENKWEFIDISGLTSWDDAARGYNSWQKSGKTLPTLTEGMDMFSAVPLLGKAKQIGTGIKHTVQSARNIPWNKIYGAFDYLRDEYNDKIDKKNEGSWVTNSSIPTPTTPSFYEAGEDRTLTNYQMGTDKAPMYGPGGEIDLHLNKKNNQKDNPRITPKGFLVQDPMGLIIGGAGFNYKANNNLNISPYAIGVGNQYFQKFPVDYGVELNYPIGNINPSVRLGKNPNIGVSYKFNNGGPVMYNAGSTVWTNQDSALWVNGGKEIGTQDKRYPSRNTGSLNTSRYRIGDVIPTGMDYKTPAAGTYDYSKDIQPAEKMVIHAPDTLRIGNVQTARHGGHIKKHINSPRVYGNPVNPSGMYKDGSTVGGGEWLPVDPRTGMPVKTLKGVEVVGEKDYGSYTDQLSKDWANTYNENPVMSAIPGTNALLTLGNLFSTPQKSMMYGLTGRYDTPSNINPTRGLGNFQNSAMDVMQDLVFDPLSFSGAFPGAFNMSKNAVRTAANTGRNLFDTGATKFIQSDFTPKVLGQKLTNRLFESHINPKNWTKYKVAKDLGSGFFGNGYIFKNFPEHIWKVSDAKKLENYMGYNLQHARFEDIPKPIGTEYPHYYKSFVNAESPSTTSLFQQQKGYTIPEFNFELMSKIKGGSFDALSANQLASIPQESWQNLKNTLEHLRQNDAGFDVVGKGNLKFNPETKSFGVIDLTPGVSKSHEGWKDHVIAGVTKDLSPLESTERIKAALKEKVASNFHPVRQSLSDKITSNFFQSRNSGTPHIPLLFHNTATADKLDNKFFQIMQNIDNIKRDGGFVQNNNSNTWLDSYN